MFTKFVITDAKTGKPIVGARIETKPPPITLRTPKTNLEGRATYRAPGIPLIWFTIVAPGYKSESGFEPQVIPPIVNAFYQPEVLIEMEPI